MYKKYKLFKAWLPKFSPVQQLNKYMYSFLEMIVYKHPQSLSLTDLCWILYENC